TRPEERLGIYIESGAPFVRIRDLRVDPAAAVSTRTAPTAPSYLTPGVGGDGALAAFSGGVAVRDGGRAAREIRYHGPPPYLQARVWHLRPRQDYAVTFWIKPLSPAATSGRVGNTSGYGWRVRRWWTPPGLTGQR